MENVLYTIQFRQYIEQLTIKHAEFIFSHQISIKTELSLSIDEIYKNPKVLIMKDIFPFDPYEYRAFQAVFAVLIVEKQSRVPKKMILMLKEMTVKSLFYNDILAHDKKLEEYLKSIQEADQNIKLSIENYEDFEVPTNFEYVHENIISKELLDAEYLFGCSCVECNDQSEKCCHKRFKSFHGNNVLIQCGKSCKCAGSKMCRRYEQPSQNLDICIFKTSESGFGLKSLKLIPKKTYLFEYIGEIVSNDEAILRKSEYLFQFSLKHDKIFVIDSKNCGNISRFINHSCSGNTEVIQVNRVDEKFSRLVFQTLRVIQPNEEITFNYGMISKERECCCKSQNCKIYY